MQIKAEIFPYDPLDEARTSTMLDLLQTGAFILRYEAKGNRYIQIINFEKHQYPHIREQDSTIPAPCKPRASTMQARLNPDVLNPESGILNPESLNTASLAGVFDSLWREYPKRLGVKEARKHFNASVKTEADISAIRIALAKYKQHVKDKERQFIQYGSTWFNNWRDWVEFSEGKDGTHDSQSITDSKALARAAREAKAAREIAPPRAISAGVRDTAELSVGQGRGSPGSGNEGDR